jgi:hypothetical protein
VRAFRAGFSPRPQEARRRAASAHSVTGLFVDHDGALLGAGVAGGWAVLFRGGARFPRDILIAKVEG